MKSLPLPKTSLLRKSWQYNAVYAEGRRVRGNGFSLIFCANNLEEDRLGISISGVSPAVKRNRLKRIIKEFYRHDRSFPSQVAQRRGPTKNNTDLVIATRKHFSPSSLSELRQALLPCLQISRKDSAELHSVSSRKTVSK